MNHYSASEEEISTLGEIFSILFKSYERAIESIKKIPGHVCDSNDKCNVTFVTGDNLQLNFLSTPLVFEM
jgi:hypothetical protein